MYIEEKHELLDNLGVIGRDFFDYIFGSDESFIDEDDYRDIEKTSILSAIQAEILDLEYGNDKPKYDGSIIINNCHNPLRELESLYDQLLALFDSDSRLKPSDVLVMTPRHRKKIFPVYKGGFRQSIQRKGTYPLFCG